MSDIKTRSALETLISTNITTGSGVITPAKHREVLNAVVRSARLILEADDADYIVTSMNLTTPPGSPANGDTYVVGASATGDWSGQDDAIAIYDANQSPAAWNFVTPTDGLEVHNVADDTNYEWDAGASPAAWTAVSGGGTVAVEDDGVSVVASSSTLNFTGSGVVVTDGGGGQADIAIAGGGGSFSGVRLKLTSDKTTQDFTSGPAISWDSEAFDVGSWADLGTNASRITVPSGVTKISLTAFAKCSSVSAGSPMILSFIKNGSADESLGMGSTSAVTALGATYQTVSSGPITVTAGDYFEVRISILSDSSVTLDGDSFFSAVDMT